MMGDGLGDGRWAMGRAMGDGSGDGQWAMGQAMVKCLKVKTVLAMLPTV